MLSTFKYCVVIPHRNVPELLEKCLQSVPKLPYLHVLVVDNSDEDKKASSVVNGFLCEFGGITIIERKPKGVGYIRNEALRYLKEQHFQGKLVFADADDYFTAEAVDCFERFKDADYDVVWFAVKGVDELGNKNSNADYVNHNIQIYNETGELGGVKYNGGPVWGKFMDMGLIDRNDIWFPEIETCEDTLFSAKVGFFSERSSVCDVPLYVYVFREGSLVTTDSARMARIGFQSAYDVTLWLKDRTEEGYRWTQYNVIWHWMFWCQKDRRAWQSFPKVYGLCDHRDALKGARKVVARRLKKILKKR